MHPSLQSLLTDATRLTRTGQLSAATQAIRQALAAAASSAASSAASGAATAPGTPVARAADIVGQAAFTAGVHSHAALTRQYKLYVPTGATGTALPLVVMLHGCTQNPDDFAAGTGMNGLADAQRFCVLYPAQAQDANPQRCWNWFKHNHQVRDRGETALIASLTQAVVRAQGIDPARVYIAGLSAGGAMAAAVAASYPELFAAVGVHSGLAPGAARSLPEGLAAMRGGAAAPQAAGSGALAVPAIVFHGDSDSTVHPRNGEQVVAAALGGRAQMPVVEQGVSAGGQRYTLSTYGSGAGPARAEHWLLHGAGHAWSGGHAAGSYTDARGPDASREMLRFFFGHTGAAGA